MDNSKFTVGRKSPGERKLGYGHRATQVEQKCGRAREDVTVRGQEGHGEGKSQPLLKQGQNQEAKVPLRLPCLPWIYAFNTLFFSFFYLNEKYTSILLESSLFCVISNRKPNVILYDTWSHLIIPATLRVCRIITFADVQTEAQTGHVTCPG